MHDPMLVQSQLKNVRMLLRAVPTCSLPWFHSCALSLKEAWRSWYPHSMAREWAGGVTHPPLVLTAQGLGLVVPAWGTRRSPAAPQMALKGLTALVEL